MILTSRKKPDFFEQAAKRSTVLSLEDHEAGLDFLISFFEFIRPKPAEKKEASLAHWKQAMDWLDLHPVLLENFRQAFLSQLVHSDLTNAFTDSGISPSRGFWQEFFARCRHKVLPVYIKRNDFLFTITRIFYRKLDYLWVQEIPDAEWLRLFQKIELDRRLDPSAIRDQIFKALTILSIHVAQLGYEREVSDYLNPEREADAPFVVQNDVMGRLPNEYAKAEVDFESGEALFEEADKSLQNCLSAIRFIQSNHITKGVSLHQTFTLVILENKIRRMRQLLGMVSPGRLHGPIDILNFLKQMIQHENRKNSIRQFLSQNVGYLAYQIAEHKGLKGSKYITDTVRQYRKMLESAMGGGAIISFIALIKNYITRLEMPVFWHGFLYSINYSLGFVLIEETGATLATKQPAFTASTLASGLDSRKNADRPDLHLIASMVARVSRSQVASFVGNLLIVFPLTWMLTWGLWKITGLKIVEGEAAMDLLENQHPWHSLSLLYACFTGFFLFASGIIAGYIQNKIRFAKISQRLISHPILRRTLSIHRLAKLAKYIENDAGSLIGNIALGFFLGMSSVVSKIFGIPFDIRHITISAANVAIGVFGTGIHAFPWFYLLVVLLGVLAIGFINFFVSFALAFIVALRSRNIHLKEYPELFGIIVRHFLDKPLDFLRPPSK